MYLACSERVLLAHLARLKHYETPVLLLLCEGVDCSGLPAADFLSFHPWNRLRSVGYNMLMDIAYVPSGGSNMLTIHEINYVHMCLSMRYGPYPSANQFPSLQKVDSQGVIVQSELVNWYKKRD
jgi:hypothetical protein